MAAYYTPARVDRILRDWPRYLSAAEGARSALPAALRPARGRPTDRMAVADIVADIQRARLEFAPTSLHGNLICYRMYGCTFSQIAQALHLSKSTVHQEYQHAVHAMATSLGAADNADEDDSSVPEVC